MAVHVPQHRAVFAWLLPVACLAKNIGVGVLQLGAAVTLPTHVELGLCGTLILFYESRTGGSHRLELSIVLGAPALPPGIGGFHRIW